MSALQDLLTEYSESHQNPLNKKIHNICVPAIMWSLLGFARSFSIFDLLNPGCLIAVLALLYYASFKNLLLLVVMVLTCGLMFISFEYVPNLRVISAVVFVLAWIGQFYGHKIEGKKPSFLKDLQFLLIGPLWVMQKAFLK